LLLLTPTLQCFQNGQSVFTAMLARSQQQLCVIVLHLRRQSHSAPAQAINACDVHAKIWRQMAVRSSSEWLERVEGEQGMEAYD
jgi:hypothetical protein